LILIYVLMAIIFFLPAILFIPVNFCGSGFWREKISGAVRLTWAGGLLSLRVTAEEKKTDVFVGLGFWIKQVSKEHSKTGAKTKIKKGKNDKKPFALTGVAEKTRLLINKMIINEILQYFSRIRRSLHLRLYLQGEYVTGDPALTGAISGLIAAFRIEPGDICVQPDFTATSMNLHGSLSGRLVPAIIIRHTVRLLFTKPARNIWWTLIKLKITKKRSVENV